MTSTLPLRKVRDFGEKINDTIRFIRIHWKNLMIMYGLFVLPFLLLAVFLGAGYFMDAFRQISGDISMLGGQWKILLAALLVFFAVNAMATSIYIFMKQLEEKGVAPSLADVAREMPKPMLTNFLYTLLLGFIVALAFVPLFLFISGMGNSPGTLVLLGLLMFVGFLLLSPYFMLIYPCNTIGEGELGGPLTAAWSLLKGRWWASVGYVLVIILIYYVLSFVVQFILTLLIGMTMLLKPENGMQNVGKGMGVVYGLSMLVQQLFYLIVFVGAGLLYYSLHEEKVGSGLEDKIDTLGSDMKDHSQEGEY